MMTIDNGYELYQIMPDGMPRMVHVGFKSTRQSKMTRNEFILDVLNDLRIINGVEELKSLPKGTRWSVKKFVPRLWS